MLDSKLLQDWNSSSKLPTRSGVYKVLHHSADIEKQIPNHNEAYAYYDANAQFWHLANWIDAIRNRAIHVQKQGARNLISAPYSEHNYRWKEE